MWVEVRTVKGSCEDHDQKVNNVLCNATIHELHELSEVHGEEEERSPCIAAMSELQNVADQVRVQEAQDMVKSVPLPPSKHQESVSDILNKALHLLSQLPPISVKLTDGNFLMWEQQVDVVVCGYGLESFLNGEANPPPQTLEDPVAGLVINPAFVAWQRQDKRVAGWLPSSLSEAALSLVVGLRSAKDIWRALETNFASRSTAKIMQYRQQMQSLKKEGLTMSEYIGKMRTYFDLLSSVGCRVSDGEQILHILGGLGQEYDPAV